MNRTLQDNPNHPDNLDVPPPIKVDRYKDIPRSGVLLSCSIVTGIMLCIAVVGTILFIYHP